jgi:hypothetical protein
MPCLWNSWTGGTSANPIRKTSHSKSIQLIFGRFSISEVISNKKLAGSGCALSRRRLLNYSVARASYANRITPQGATVKPIAWACPASAQVAVMAAVSAPEPALAAEALPDVVRATG